MNADSSLCPGHLVGLAFGGRRQSDTADQRQIPGQVQTAGNRSLAHTDRLPQCSGRARLPLLATNGGLQDQGITGRKRQSPDRQRKRQLPQQLARQPALPVAATGPKHPPAQFNIRAESDGDRQRSRSKFCLACQAHAAVGGRLQSVGRCEFGRPAIGVYRGGHHDAAGPAFAFEVRRAHQLFCALDDADTGDESGLEPRGL